MPTYGRAGRCNGLRAPAPRTCVCPVCVHGRRLYIATSDDAKYPHPMRAKIPRNTRIESVRVLSFANRMLVLL